MQEAAQTQTWRGRTLQEDGAIGGQKRPRFAEPDLDLAAQAGTPGPGLVELVSSMRVVN
jgi:hypothetical protein